MRQCAYREGEVIKMLLVYLLFALTVSTILTALFAERIPEDRKGEAFISFFSVLIALAWAADKWLFPALADGFKTAWVGALALIVFGGVFLASAILSVRTPGPLKRAVVYHNGRLDAEAAVFDLALWFATLAAGITVMKSIGL
jgi:hypothetical protein